MLNNGANYRTNSRREIFQSEILEKSFLGEGERGAEGTFLDVQ